MRVVVTGVTGNVGTAVARRLAREPHVSTIGVSRRPPPAAAELPISEWHRVDLSGVGAQATLSEAFNGADAVIHLAWAIQPSHHRESMRETNVSGTQRVLAAAEAAGVAHVVAASSVGAYSPAVAKSVYVDEDWPTNGISGSAYSQDKSAQERLLDRFERQNPEVLVTRLRPGLIFQRSAASEIARYFLGPWIPAKTLPRLRVPVLPIPRAFVFQAVHADDAAEAYAAAVLRRVGGAFNVAAVPPLGPADLAAIVHARPIPLPTALARAAAAITWGAHVQPTDSGWIALAANAPLMSTERARLELGWTPLHDADMALSELVEGLREGMAAPTPPLRTRKRSRLQSR